MFDLPHLRLEKRAGKIIRERPVGGKTSVTDLPLALLGSARVRVYGFSLTKSALGVVQDVQEKFFMTAQRISVRTNDSRLERPRSRPTAFDGT